MTTTKLLISALFATVFSLAASSNSNGSTVSKLLVECLFCVKSAKSILIPWSTSVR